MQSRRLRTATSIYKHEKLMNDVVFSTDKSLIDVLLVHRFLNKESYWAKGIPLQTVEQSIANSLCFGVYTASKQIGFARIISD